LEVNGIIIDCLFKSR